MQNRLFDKCPMAPLAVCMIVGIIITHGISLPIPVLPVLVGMVVVVCLLKKRPLAQSAAIFVCCILLGMCIMQRQLQVSNMPQTESRLERSKAFFHQQRGKLLQRLSDNGLEGDAYAVVAAMSLGDKTELSRDIRNTYSVSGASHVLALSGLHLGIIYMLLSLLLPSRRWRVLSQVVILLLVWAFVMLVGMPVSAVRSAIMLTLYGALSLGGRNKMSINVLAFTSIVMLMWNPAWLFDVGFQMSFMAVWAILLFVPLFEDVFTAKYLMEHRWIKRIWDVVAVSFSAQLGVAPLIAYYFGRFSTFFMFTNFIVIPAAFVILYLSLVVFIIPSFAYLLLYIVTWVNTLLAVITKIPGASIEGLHPSVIQVVLIYVLIFCIYLLIERIKPIVGWTPLR